MNNNSSENRWVKCSGNSMSPTIKDEEFVYIQEFDNNTGLKSGDILLFKENGGSIIHRLISVERRNNITMGDNSIATDHFKPQISDIRGICLYRKRDEEILCIGGLRRRSTNALISFILLYGERYYLAIKFLPEFFRKPLYNLYRYFRGLFLKAVIN
jgi:hypothetical protein